MRDNIYIRPKAYEDINSISEKHLMLVGINSSEKIEDDIFNTIDLLSENPYLGRVAADDEIAEKGYRTLVCGNYICFYKISGDIVTVYRVLDGRTNYKKRLLYSR